MSLKDRFRIDELVKKGSKTITREKDGGIVVRKENKKYYPSKDTLADLPFGTEPIKGKQVSARFKSDLNEVDEPFVQEQTSFSGETSGYVEKPKYNEEELQKAIDVKVDELIKKERAKKGPYVKQGLYDKLRENFDSRIVDIEDLRAKLDAALAREESLKTENLSLQQQLDASLQQQSVAENQNTITNDRYVGLLADFQNSIIKGTKEAVERVSLTAQVRGLQAQKAALVRSEELEEQAQAQTAAIDIITGIPNSFGQKNNSGWKIPEDGIDNPDEIEKGNQFRFQSLRYSSGWSNGETVDLYNLAEEPVSYSISVSPKNGGHNPAWSSLSPSSGQIPAREGETPGKVTVTISKVRNVRSPSGRKKNFDDNVKITIGSDVYDLRARFYRKLRTKGKGN